MVLICRTKEDQKQTFPVFYLSDQTLLVCSSCKYLGHIINDKLEDDADLFRQRCILYAQANMLARKFSFCSTEVKVNLFRAYCTPLYTAPLWVNYKKESLRKLKVAYNDALRILLKRPRGGSDSGLTTFQALLRNLMFSFKCRLDRSLNVVITALTNPRYSSVRYSSCMWKHWYVCLL